MRLYYINNKKLRLGQVLIQFIVLINRIYHIQEHQAINEVINLNE